MECWTRGEMGHRALERKGAGRKGAGNAALIEKLEDVVAMLRGATVSSTKNE